MLTCSLQERRKKVLRSPHGPEASVDDNRSSQAIHVLHLHNIISFYKDQKLVLMSEDVKMMCSGWVGVRWSCEAV